MTTTLARRVGPCASSATPASGGAIGWAMTHEPIIRFAIFAAVLVALAGAAGTATPAKLRARSAMVQQPRRRCIRYAAGAPSPSHNGRRFAARVRSTRLGAVSRHRPAGLGGHTARLPGNGLGDLSPTRDVPSGPCAVAPASHAPRRSGHRRDQAPDIGGLLARCGDGLLLRPADAKSLRR